MKSLKKGGLALVSALAITMVVYGQTSVIIDGNNIRANNSNGLTFKGFGVLSANGTSALLMDYKADYPETYGQLLRVLFGGIRPIMTHVKIEMGNDRNNSTGPDPATMRWQGEAVNVKRHPGFQLAADAKRLNPDLKVSILRWNAPAWVNNNEKVYTWYKTTILAAYREYGYMVDYINPGVNERGADLNWTKRYAERIKSDSSGFLNSAEQMLYNSIKVVISDEAGIGSFGDEMVADFSLRNAVAVAAYHYNTDDDSGGHYKRLAEQFDKEVWNSEAQATFSNTSFRPHNNMRDPSVAGTGIGGTYGALEMGNTVIKGFYKSRRTHFIYQPAIGSFYEGGQYSFKELISARDPWSGWIHYDGGLQILRHFSWFSQAGWENRSNSRGIWRVIPESSYTGATGTNPINGRNGSPSYMTIAAPDKQDFSTVFVNDSEYTRAYRLQTFNMNYGGRPSLELWQTRAADTGQAFNSNYMRYLGSINADGSGIYTVNVPPYAVVTVTTLNNSDRSEFLNPLPVEGLRTVLDTNGDGSEQDLSDNILYADDFDYTEKSVPLYGSDGNIIGNEDYIASRGGNKSILPRYTSDRNGAFEAYLPDGSNNYVLRQQVDRSAFGLGGTWNGGDPITGIGDSRWLNYRVSVDVSFEHSSVEGGDNYGALGARQQGGGSSHNMNGTPYFLKFWYDGGWMLKVDGNTVASGNVVSGSGGVTIGGFDTRYNAWHNLALELMDNKVTAFLDGVALASYTDSRPRLSGRIDLASGYYFTRFDNLKVETIPGKPPYYTEFLDNLEMTDLSAPPKTKLIYQGSWSHENGKSMYNYMRTLSTSRSAGAVLEYSFNGTGLDILGPNNGSARLEVTVDGQVLHSSAPTMAAQEFYQTFTLRGLEPGQHRVRLRLLSGTLVVDSVAVIGNAQGDDGDDGGDHSDTGPAYQLLAKHSGLALEAAGSAAGAQIQQGSYSDGSHQQWQLRAAANGQYEIVGLESGKCLGIDGDNAANGSRLQLEDCTGASDQRYGLIGTGEGYFRITPNQGSDYSLDVSNVSMDAGAAVIIWESNGGDNQQWLLQPVAGSYQLKARHSGKVLEAVNEGNAVGTLLQQWAYRGGAHQLWQLSSRGNNQFAIVGVGSERCVGVSGNSLDNGARFQLEDCAGETDQAFNVTASEVGYFRISPSHAPNSCMDVAGIAETNGAAIHLWEWLAGSNQQWSLVVP